MLKTSWRRIAALIALACAIATPALANPLKWKAPAMVNALVWNVPAGQAQLWCRRGEDVVINWPKSKHLGSVTVANCHNVISIGGWNTVPVAKYPNGRIDSSNLALSRGLYLKDITGTAHIEGLLIDSSGGAMEDGIVIAAPLATVQIQYVRIEGLSGYNDEFHADCVQPYGGVKALRIDRFTCYTGYQGLSIWGVPASPKGWTADIEHTNIYTIGPFISGRHNSGGYIFWPCMDAACANAALISLYEVYLQPRPGHPFTSAIYTPSMSVWLVRSGASVGQPAMNFPNMPIIGHVTAESRTVGDFVPSGLAGLGYRSPG